jgi:hypothetical protein
VVTTHYIVPCYCDFPTPALAIFVGLSISVLSSHTSSTVMATSGRALDVPHLAFEGESKIWSRLDLFKRRVGFRSGQGSFGMAHAWLVHSVGPGWPVPLDWARWPGFFGLGRFLGQNSRLVRLYPTHVCYELKIMARTRSAVHLLQTTSRASPVKAKHWNLGSRSNRAWTVRVLGLLRLGPCGPCKILYS